MEYTGAIHHERMFCFLWRILRMEKARQRKREQVNEFRSTFLAQSPETQEEWLNILLRRLFLCRGRSASKRRLSSG